MFKDIVGYNEEFYFNDTKPDGTMAKLTDPGANFTLLDGSIK
jgi:hypothetical protein